jgi:protein-disulfide isomerase
MQVIKPNKQACLLVALSLLLLTAIIVMASAHSDSPASRRHLVLPRESSATKRTYALLESIPQHGAVLGYPQAPVTLQFFGDLQCLDSRWVMIGALPFVIRRWVRTGKVQIRFRSTETDTKGAGGWFEFREQQVAALAAGKQDKLWHFIDVFYREQGPEFTGYVDEAFLDRIAEQAGLDMERWEDARRPPEDWVPQIEAEEALAKAKRLDETPSFLIGPTGGAARPLRHFSLDEPKVFDEAVEGLL